MKASFALLFRHFVERQFESDLAPEGSDLSDKLAFLVPIFAAPAAMVTLWLFPKYALVADVASDRFLAVSRGDRLFFLGYSMAAVGLLTFLVWEVLFPDRRDAAALGVLPLRARTLVAARLAAFFATLLAFAFAINLPSALGFALAAGGSAGVPDALRLFAAHLSTTILSGLFVALSIVAVQAMVALVFPERAARHVAVAAQLVAIVALIEWLVFSPGFLARLDGNETFFELSMFPPLWFLALYDRLIGASGEAVPLGASGLRATFLVLVVAALVYGLAYARVLRSGLETRDPRHRRAGVLLRFVRRVAFSTLLRDETERAVVAFVAASLARSRKHRLVLAAYVAVALSFVIGSFLGPVLREETILLSTPTARLLSIPLLLSFFVLMGLRILFAVPTELGANWIFQMTESDDPSRYGSGMRKSMAILGLLPIALATLPLYNLLWGAPLAFAHTLFWFLLGLLWIEALSIGFHRVPFACSYAPGKANAKLLWPLYLAALVTYAYVPASFEVWLLARPARWAVACGLLASCLAIAALNRRLWSGSPPLRYEDTSEEPMDRLELTTR